MGLVLQIGANVQPAISEITKLKTGVSSLGDTIETLRAKLLARQSFLNTETDVKKIAVLNAEIKDLEAEILRVKSIGAQGGADAFSKLTDGASNAFSAIRKLAYILPGIGIAGLFDVAFSSIQKFVNAIEGINVPKFKDLQDSIAGAKDEFVKATITVNDLKNEIEAAKNGFISKEGVIKHYNETIGKTTGLVTSLNQAEQDLVAKGPAFIQFTLLKAAAQIALGKSAEVLFKAAQQNQKDLERISKITPDKEGIGQFIASGEENLRKAEQESFSKRVDSLNDIAKKFQDEAAAIAKQFNFNFFQDTKPEKAVKEKVEKVNKELKNVEFEVPIVPVVGSLIKQKNTFQDFVKDLNKGVDLPKIDVNKITPDIQKRIDEIIKAKQEALKLAQAVQGALTPAFESVFQALESHQNVFKAFFKSLEQTVTQLISKFLAAAAAAEIVSLVLSGGSGAFSGLFTKLIGGGIPHLASGGITTGPTTALIGESGPEVVMPLDRLRGMLGGLALQGQAVTVTGRISGNDILLSNARQTSKNNRGG